MFNFLKRIGPGAIVASATIGAGETVLAVRAGAWAGHGLLWLVLLAIVTKSFLTLYLLGRYAAVSGHSVAEKLVDLPGPRGWFLWLLLVLEGLVAPMVFVVIAVPCGVLISRILATGGVFLSYKWPALIFVTLAIGIGILQKYDTLERSQVIVCLVLFIGTVVSTALVGPNLPEIFRGLLQFGHFPHYPPWIPEEIKERSPLLEIAAVFGYAGSISMNYVVYSNWVVLKGWTAPRTGSVKKALVPLRWDVGFNATLVLLVTGSFMVAGATVLRPLQKIPLGFDLLTEQAHIFAQISPAVIPLYYVLILTALWGTLNALPDIYARGASSFLQQLLPDKKGYLAYKSIIKIFGPVMLFLTWVFIWTEARPMIMIDLVALFSTNIGVGLVCLSAVWLDQQLDPHDRCSSIVRWATVLSSIAVNLMAMVSAREVIRNYF